MFNVFRDRSKPKKLPETRSPARTFGKVGGAGVSAADQLNSRRDGNYHSPGQAFKDHPHAATLALFDGRVRLGLVLDTRRQICPGRRPPSSPSYDFDFEDRFVGEFGSRKIAAAAISARHAFDRKAA